MMLSPASLSGLTGGLLFVRLFCLGGLAFSRRIIFRSMAHVGIKPARLERLRITNLKRGGWIWHWGEGIWSGINRVSDKTHKRLRCGNKLPLLKWGSNEPENIRLITSRCLGEKRESYLMLASAIRLPGNIILRQPEGSSAKCRAR